MGLQVTIEGKTSDVYRTSSTKGPYMLGTRMVFPDGRVYRYAKSGAAIAIAVVCGHPALTATLASDMLPSGSQARTTAQWDAGTQIIYVATTASGTATNHISANRFDDGYLWVTDLAGQGQILQIKSHGVSTSSGTTAVAMNIYEEDLLTIAVTTASQFGIVPNLYSGVVTHTGTTGGGPALGVTPCTVSATSKYFWMQTWGPCPVLSGATLPLAGQQVGIINTSGGSTGATGVAGTIYPLSATKYMEDYKGAVNNPKVGFCLVPAVADADASLVFLTISP